MIKPIDFSEAKDFYLRQKAGKIRVSINQKGEWFGFTDAGGQLVGIVSASNVGKYTRVKTLLVCQSSRCSGIGTALVLHVSSERKCTAFALETSIGIFQKAGFVEVSKSAAGVSFMRKELP